jgi:helicase MOV-10
MERLLIGEITRFRVQLRGGANQRLVRNSPVRLEVAFRQRHLGRYEDRVDIVFDDAQAKQQFVIARPLRAIIGDRRDYELLRPRAPYVPRTQGRREPETEVVPGEAPESTNAIPWVVRLLRADIPKPLLTTLSDASSTDIMRNLRRVHLPPALTSETYSRHFTSLLWVEEHQMTYGLASIAHAHP